VSDEPGRVRVRLRSGREDRLLAAIAANLEAKPSLTISPPSVSVDDDTTSPLARTLPRLPSTGALQSTPSRNRPGPVTRLPTGRLHPMSDLYDSLDELDFSGLDSVGVTGDAKTARRRSGKTVDGELLRLKGDTETLRIMGLDVRSVV
jgi:hypothetical protein